MAAAAVLTLALSGWQGAQAASADEYSTESAKASQRLLIDAAHAGTRVVVVGDSGSFPGPDWMPKQAHMADLQAEAAAHNLLAELAGGRGERGFKVKLICIIDAIDQGTLVYRTEQQQIVLPPNRLMHWAKRSFERRYLRHYQ